jgi:hypothetical protein
VFGNRAEVQNFACTCIFLGMRPCNADVVAAGVAMVVVGVAMRSWLTSGIKMVHLLSLPYHAYARDNIFHQIF